ncbi:YafY family protein [Actinotalea sp. K2]|uniref:helix-turn-helix transcriptional regulator n=1 Tax=Actinotalea sp. K2 TaxID=2939438 RepID=UPI002017094B|nr:WYL domain-containing protein [Actinotalea sp. K2]MCL3861674.1 WYL domain-containing protein [Actinotalea sp. K2]
MNRTDRLYAVSEELRRAGRRGATGARLARLLEVSERTIKRDVSALQQAGAPIGARPGPGGGYVLEASASLPPVNFTPAQAVAVAVALAALPPGSPFSADGASARGKVWDALGPADRDRARDLAARIWFDAGSRSPDDRTAPAVDGTTGAPGGAVPPPVLRAIETALTRRLVLALTYRSAAGEVTRRSVEPVILGRAEGAWYLIAWCRSRQAIRWFRLSRIERADLTREQHPARDVSEAGAPPAGATAVGGDD